MIRQSVKDAYFSLSRFLCLPSTWAASVRYRRSARRDPRGLYVHLGCGFKYIEGMINADGNRFRKIDVWLDLRNRLPFPDKSCRLVYSSHTLEHLYPDEARALLREIRRVLADDGEARIAVPSLEHALRVARGEVDEDWPRPFDDPHAQAINYLFCDGQHKYAYNFAVLRRFAEEAGFSRVVDFSADRGVAAKSYGGIVVGGEPEGSLVVELSA